MQIAYEIASACLTPPNQRNQPKTSSSPKALVPSSINTGIQEPLSKAHSQLKRHTKAIVTPGFIKVEHLLKLKD